MKQIQSELHKIGTNEVHKISLSCFDDKRYILADGINSLAYFQKNIYWKINLIRIIIFMIKIMHDNIHYQVFNLIYFLIYINNETYALSFFFI